MSTTVFLDPAKLAALEPSVVRDRHTQMLSSFAVPSFVVVMHAADGAVASFRFDYDAPETELPEERLDDLDSPVIAIKTGRYTKKITRLEFDQPVGHTEMARVAARLRAQAGVARDTARCLSYRMVASVLDEWREAIFSPPRKPG